MEPKEPAFRPNWPLWQVTLGAAVLGAFIVALLKYDPWSWRPQSKAEISTAPRKPIPLTAKPAADMPSQTLFNTVSGKLAGESTKTVAPETNVAPETISADQKAELIAQFNARTAWFDSATSGKAYGIRGRILLEGTPPPEKPLPLDPQCGSLLHSGATTQFYVTDAEGGLADVVVVITSGAEGITFTEPEPPLVIQQTNCTYVPYVSAISTSGRILVKNADPLLHNVHPTPAIQGNPESNRAQLPRGADLEYQFTQPETFLRFKCDVHPWMFAYVTVVPHRFYSVTDKNGVFWFPPLPPGKYQLQAMHRKAGSIQTTAEIRSTGSKLTSILRMRVGGATPTTD